MKMRIFLGVIVIAMAIVLGKYYFDRTQPNIVSSSNSTIITSPSPTPDPFYDLTIPYLRSRTYQSSIGERTVHESNSTYTSYLTSYFSDNLRINGLLTIPTGQMPPGGWPAIVFVHGYIPPRQYQTTTRYLDHVDYLARNGFVVFKIDLRGHGDSEGDAGGAYYGSEYIIDTLHAYAALQSSDFVDKNKIGLWGHSMAGNVVLRSLAAKPDIPAGVIWAGAGFTYTDLRRYGISDNSYQPPPSPIASANNNRRQRLAELHGQPNPDDPFWKQIIPTNHLSEFKGAIQLDHATDDDVVNIGYSRDLVAILDQTSIPHELHEYPSGGHNISGSSFSSAIQNTVTFFKTHLSD
jgi:uncharacterized protein